MSWDIYIQHFPDVSNVNDIPDDFRPSPIGSVTEVEAKVARAWPDAAKQDNGWFFLKQAEVDLSAQVVRAENDQASHIVVHVHDGASSPQAIAKLIRELDLRALDTSTGQFFDLERPEAGYEAWKKFRDNAEK